MKPLVGESKVHHVSLKQEQSRCCGNAAHWHWRFKCSCGWTETCDDRDDTGLVILHHRVAVVEGALGIDFRVEDRKRR